LTLGSTPLFTPPLLPIGRSASTLLPSLPSSTSPCPVFQHTGGLGDPATHLLVASRLSYYLSPCCSIHSSCLGSCCPPFLALPLQISSVLSVVLLVTIAATRWGLLVPSWFP